MPTCDNRLETSYINYVAGTTSAITDEYYFVTKTIQTSKHNIIRTAISMVYYKYSLFVNQYCSGFPIKSLIAQIVCWIRDSKVHQTDDMNYGQVMTFVNAVAGSHGLLEVIGTVDNNYIKTFNLSMQTAFKNMCGNLTPPHLVGDGYDLSCNIPLM